MIMCIAIEDELVKYRKKEKSTDMLVKRLQKQSGDRMPFRFFGRQSFLFFFCPTNSVMSLIKCSYDRMLLVKEAVFDVYDRLVGQML